MRINREYYLYGCVKALVIPFISLSILMCTWWILSIEVNSTVLPTPRRTFASLQDLFINGVPGTTRPYTEFIFSTLCTFIKGTIISAILAVPTGLVVGYIKPLKEFLSPMIEVIRPIAPIAWAPIFIISFGYKLGATMVVFMGMLFPILTNVMFGVTKIESNVIDAAMTLGANKLQIFTKITFPSSVPYILNGLKIAIGVGWMCIVAAELYADALGGIGGFLNMMANDGRWSYVYANILIISMFGLATTGVMEYAQRFILNRMGFK